MKILGIDPGSRAMGYALLQVGPRGKILSFQSGTLRVPLEGTDTPDRLVFLFEKLTQLIVEHRPEVLSIEKVFFSKNPVSALKLGQARGVALLACRRAGLPVYEYNPTEVKAAITGYGRAEKLSVEKILRLLLARDLSLPASSFRFDTLDASDAVAIALCHARLGMLGAPPVRASAPTLKTPKGKKTSLAEILVSGRLRSRKSERST